MTGKFSFVYEDVWFDVKKFTFIVKNSSFKMLVVFSPIFVVDTKITLDSDRVKKLEMYFGL